MYFILTLMTTPMRKKTIFIILAMIVVLLKSVEAQYPAMPVPMGDLSPVWIPDLGNGKYKNPVIYADYSDPDVVRVGEDFFMTASSFNCVPGLPVLHSKDLVNWTLIGYALDKLEPEEVFNKPQHGKGVWAPCIKYHNDEFYIYYPDPDFGIFMVKAADPRGPWSKPILVKGGKGLIDPSPLWDDDGKAYLTYALAGSRAGVKSILLVAEMDPSGERLIGESVIVFDGHDKHPTIEGPKFYKRNGYYYIFAPGGGVKEGWQVVLRSKNVFGPYEDRITLTQGNTDINGSHQGAWVELENGESWFVHFQDKGAYGRIVHLNPVIWKDDWPVMGVDKDGDGTGEPVSTYRKPDTGRKYPAAAPVVNDEFDSNKIGLQWQWHANPQQLWAFPMGAHGVLRLYSVPLPENFTNFFDVPNLLMQKLTAPEFTATTKLTFTPRLEREKAGLIVMGRDYSYLSLEYRNGKTFISQTVCKNADQGASETQGAGKEVKTGEIYLRVKVSKDAICEFSYSEDGRKFTAVGEPFKAREGVWIGAKIGYFMVRDSQTNDAGNIDIDWFRVEK